METGIYQIRNTVTNKRYIGSAVNIAKRWNEHRNCLVRNIHGNSYLQRAWNKYGSDSFVFSIVILCEKDELLTFEQRKIDRYKISQAGIYNLSPTAGNNLGVKFSQETKDKISKSQKGKIIPLEQRERISQTLQGNIPWNKGLKGVMPAPWNKGTEGIVIAWNKGIPCSEEMKHKLSEAHKGQIRTEDQKRSTSETIKKTIEERGGHWNIGFHHAEETKQRIASYQKGRPKSEETKRRMIEGRKGYVCSEETKRKISETKKLNGMLRTKFVA